MTNRRREIEAIIQKAENKNDKQAEENRFRALPEWLEEITGKFEDTQVPALANTCQDSDSERRAKLASGKHSIETNFPKDRNCEICLRIKMTRLRAEDVLVQSCPDRKILVI